MSRDPEIHTARLYVRRPAEQDFPRFYGMLTDPVAKRYTGGITRQSYLERKQTFLSDCAHPFSADGAEFSVLCAKTGQYLGYCGFRQSEELPAPEFLFGYCRDAWGMGIATEAGMAILDWMFHTYAHPFYLATLDPENQPSRRVLQKLGFMHVKTLPSEAGGYEMYRVEASSCN